VRTRLEEAGLSEVRFEPFGFLGWEKTNSSLEVRVDGVSLPMLHDVFAYSGAGSVTAELIDVGTGHEQAYAGKDVSGKIVVVTGDRTFHRSSQYSTTGAAPRRSRRSSCST
jgi:Iap family predicted aminopeptidase